MVGILLHKWLCQRSKLQLYSEIYDTMPRQFGVTVKTMKFQTFAVENEGQGHIRFR